MAAATATATTSSLKLTIFFSLTLILLLLFVQSQVAFSIDVEDVDDVDDNEVYVLDNPVGGLGSRSSRSLARVVIKKGTHCNAAKSICNGVSANNGTSLLYCCKTHCRNIRGDRNNCGRCGNKCKFGQLCCNGTCTSVAYNDNHCGKCNKKCPNGVKCDYGVCGYA